MPFRKLPAETQKLANSDTPFGKEFKTLVAIPNPSEDDGNWFRGNSPNTSAMLKLRLICWLAEYNLVDGVDYEVRSSADGKLYYAFKDANKAMMFKLAWV